VEVGVGALPGGIWVAIGVWELDNLLEQSR